MNETTNRQIGDLESKLSLLLREIKGGPIEPRVQLWIGKMCAGRKLGEWVQDAKVPDKDKLTVLRSLIDLLLTKSYDRLPEVPVPEPISGGDDNARKPAPTRRDEPPVIPSDPASPATSDEMPAPDDLREMIRHEVRQQLAGMLETIARAIRESK